jgi:hypothetical protein
VTTIVLPGRTSVLQHERDSGVFVVPHTLAMCLQHLRSGVVITLAVTAHPNKGAATQQRVKRTDAMAVERRMKRV